MDASHARPAGALRVELKVMVTHCYLATRVAPDRHAKPLRLARLRIRTRMVGLEGGLRSSRAADMQPKQPGTVIRSGYRLQEDPEAYGRTPHASQLTES